MNVIIGIQKRNVPRLYIKNMKREEFNNER